MDTNHSSAPVPQGVDESLFAMVWSALKESPKTRSLTEEQISHIAVGAIEQSKFNDELWLHQKIQEAEESSPNIPGSRIPKIPVKGPASIETQDDLNTVIIEHQAWMDSVLHPNKPNVGGRANLSHCDLRELNLNGVDLRGANFTGANLSGCQIIGANLSTANFSGAILQGAQLQGAKLRRCNFENADLTDCNLEGADIRRVDFQSCSTEGANMTKTLSD